MLFIFGGLAVFGLALGISRGFPAGEPVPMDALQRVVHQMGVVVISLFIIWWFIVKRKRLSFSFLWRIEIMLVAAGMLILSVFPGHFTGLAIATVNIPDTLMLGVLWITPQAVAPHTTTDVYAVSGCASPCEVKITVAVRCIRSRRTISPGQEFPASINANASSPSIISSESATPNCEL